MKELLMFKALDAKKVDSFDFNRHNGNNMLLCSSNVIFKY